MPLAYADQRETSIEMDIKQNIIYNIEIFVKVTILK